MIKNLKLELQKVAQREKKMKNLKVKFSSSEDEFDSIRGYQSTPGKFKSNKSTPHFTQGSPADKNHRFYQRGGSIQEMSRFNFANR